MLTKYNIKSINLLKRTLPIFSVITTAFILGWLLWFSQYGFDFTDESFYLVWISNPFNYNSSLSQFGFIYHPLYELLDGNIAYLRQTNILITFCLAWMFCNYFLKVVFDLPNFTPNQRLTISAAFATSSLIWLSTWLPTPNYNSLNFQSLLISATGLLLARKNSNVSLTGCFMIGTGGWLAFMAKPTTAAALSLCAVIFILISCKFKVRILAISLATAIVLLVLSALIIDGSIFKFIERLQTGIEMGKILGGGHTITQLVRLDSVYLSDTTYTFLEFGIVLSTFIAFSSQSKSNSLIIFTTLLSIFLSLLCLTIILGAAPIALNIGPYQNLLVWSIPFAAIITSLLIHQPKEMLKITPIHWALALLLLATPHIYAFGTNNNYWIQGSAAAVFWILSGIVFLVPITSSTKLITILLPLSIFVQLVSVTLIHKSIESPYRQPQPLHHNNYSLDIGKPKSTLILTQSYGDYIKEATNIAEQAGFKKRTPMIDMTGHFPGILYALNANSIGQAWTLGGYSGSNKLAKEMLSQVSCENLSTAWLLTEPKGPRKISPSTLLSYGANIKTDFEIVGTLKTAKGAGGYKQSRTQHLLKPIRSFGTAMTACTTSRIIK